MKINKFLLIIVLSLVLISLVYAAIPTPHAFKGIIIVEDGKNPNGKLIVGYVNGVATGSAQIKGNSYEITVIDYTGFGGDVEFYIGDIKSKEKFTFTKMMITNTNLTFRTIPINDVGTCGDNYCEPGECSVASSCPIDCKVSQCLNDGICNANIGEDCVTAPSDCGVCVYCGDSICNNGETCSTCPSDCGVCSAPTTSSGGGGGGGSSKPKDLTIALSTTNITETEDSNPDFEGLNIDELNENQGKKGITGRTIDNFGDFAKSGYGIGLGIFIILLAVFAVISSKRNKEEAPKMDVKKKK